MTRVLILLGALSAIGIAALTGFGAGLWLSRESWPEDDTETDHPSPIWTYLPDGFHGFTISETTSRAATESDPTETGDYGPIPEVTPRRLRQVVG